MIKCKNLNIRMNEQIMVKDASFTIPTGNVALLMGLKGCGKTALLNCIGGNIKEYLGMIDCGENCRHIVDLPEFCEKLTGRDYLDMLLAVAPQRLKDEVNELITIIGIHKDLENNIDEVCLYTQKILILLSSVSLGSDLILLDEPFANLDFQSQKKMLEVIHTLRAQNKTILIATNVIDLGFQVADDLLILHRGKIKQLKNKFKDIFQYEKKIMSILIK